MGLTDHECTAETIHRNITIIEKDSPRTHRNDLGVTIISGDIRRQHCWNQALRAYGTEQNLKRHAKRLRDASRIVSFLGIVPPLLVGGLLLAFSDSKDWQPIAISIAGVIAMIQALFQAWSWSSHWEEQLAKLEVGSVKNLHLWRQYEALAMKWPAEYEQQLEKLEGDYTEQAAEDERLGLTQEEQRFGMRHALRKFGRTCQAPTCGAIPISMKPTNCDVCGNFNEKWVK